MKTFFQAARAALYLGAVALGAPALAQSVLPQIDYDPGIPTVQAMTGADIGERITPSGEVIAYFRALEAAAPDRIQVRPYARSWQGRELAYAIIGSPQNLARLDEIQDGMQRLADPRSTSQAEADALIADLPAITWLAYTVHGDELSPADAAMALAYHVLAAQDDAVVDTILENSLVVIDPVQNPDGRDRFVNNYYDTLGLAPQGSPIAAERNERWPRGRVNHYLFDMNRDWFALTQPETQGRIAAFLEWFPQIFVDIHEMGTNTTYYSPQRLSPTIPISPRASARSWRPSG